MAQLTSQLLVRLVDGVSAPARVAARSLQSLQAMGRRAVTWDTKAIGRQAVQHAREIRERLGNASNWALGASGIGLGKLHEDVYKFAMATNKLNAANPDITAEQIKRIADLSRQISRGTLFAPDVVMDAANALARADVSVDAIAGSLGPLARGAMAADVPVSQLADDFVKLSSGFGLSLKTERDAKETFSYLADLAQYVGQKAPGSFNDFVQAMKQVGPTVQSLGVKIESLAGAYILLDKAGIRNEEAGVALKSLFKSIVQPTAGGRAVEAMLGMDPSTYTKRADLGGEQLIKFMAEKFGKNFAAIGPDLDRALKAGGTDAEIRGRLSKLIEDAWGGNFKPQDAQKVTKAINAFMSMAVVGIDPDKWLEEAAKRGMTFGQMLQRLEPRQANKLTNLFPKDKADAAMNTPLSQMRDFRRGIADEAAQKMLGGYVGSIQKLNSAWSSLIESLDKAGAIDAAAAGLTKLGEAAVAMSRGTATLSEWAVGLTALSPALVALARAFQLLGGGFLLGLVAKGFVALAGGIAAVVGAPVWLVALAIAAVGAAVAAAWIYWDKLKEWAAYLGDLAMAFGRFSVDFAAQVVQALGDVAKAFYDAGVKMMDMLWEGLKSRAQAIVDWITSWGEHIKSAMNPGNWFGGSAPAPAPAAPGHRAAGGPVIGGRAYVVGERGPELFVPGRSGSIVPNGTSRGHQIVVSPVFHFNGQQNASEIASAVKRVMREEVRQLFRGLQSDTGVVFA